MDMENRFEFCCSDFDVVRSTSECNRLTCDGNIILFLLFCFKRVVTSIVIVLIVCSWDNIGDVFVKIKN